MANGTVNGSVTYKSNYFSFYFEWSSVPNNAGNYSDVTVKTYWKTNNTSQTFDTVGSRNASITINGTTASISKVFAVYWSKVGNPYLIQTATQRVYHNEDGSKSITISARANGHASSWGPSSSTSSSGDCTASATVTLDTIPRKANIVSAPDFNDEQNPTITYSNLAGNSVESLDACISFTGATDEIKYRSISTTGSSYTFNLTTEERNELRNSIPNSNSRTVMFCVRTVIGGVTYYSSLTRTMTIVNATPVFTSDSNKLRYWDSNESVFNITQNRGMIVQNKSNLTVTCDAGAATAKKGASITQYSITVNGVTKTLTAAGGSVNFGVINSKTNLTLSAKVTDSRGNVSSAVNKTITCYEYYTPSFTSFNAYRCDANGEATLDGTYIKWDYDVNYASVNNKNRCTTKIYGTPSGSGSATSSGSKIQVNDDGTYKIYAIATDAFGGTTQSLVDVVYGPVRVLNISPDGSNIAIGKIVDGYDDEGVLDCRWKIKTGDPANTMQNFSYRGTNAISSIANDTIQNWNNQGNLATTIYTEANKINGQPTQYGFLLNLTTGPGGKEAHQLWMAQPNGNIYHRGGNSSGLSTTWKTLLDSSHIKDYVVEQGTSGGFKYRKWNSGISEAWYRKELGDIDLIIEKANGVWTNDTYKVVSLTLPSGLFVEAPTATGNISSSGYTLFQVSSSSPTAVAYRIWSSHSSNPTNCAVSIQLIGKWK